jgi:hypothetical protein
MIDYMVRDAQGVAETFQAKDDAAAKTFAAAWISEGEYGEIEESFRVHATLYVSATEDLSDLRIGEHHWAVVGEVSWTFHPREPVCPSGGHDYRAPYEIVGGLKENPGVWGGDNGGLFVLEVCMHCGCSKSERTRASDGQGGHMTSVTYSKGEYADEVQRLRSEVSQ